MIYLGVLALLSFLILVHELGHFVVAKLVVMSCLEALFPRVVRLRVPLTLLGMVVLAVLMIYANAQDVVRYWL